MIPTWFGVTIVLFIMLRTMPGDIVALMSGEYGVGDEEMRAALLKEFGLDQNWAVQYFRWMGNLATGDFGHSLISGRSVSSELSTRLPVTAELGFLTIFISTIVAIPIGVISAIRQNTVSDYAGRSLAIGFLAAPDFWLALMLITIAGRWFVWAVPPATYPGFMADPISNLKFMIVPALIMGVSSSGGVMRFTRSSMLEVLRQDYVRTAWAKGLPERTIVIRHVLRNALIPVVTIIGARLPFLIGGTIIIESIYSIPGMGRYFFTALGNLDFPVVQAIVVVSAVVVLVSNLLIDLSYSWLDPRIRYS